MKVISARNVHEALPQALDELRACGVRRDSRNGPVVMFPEPVTTVYRKPAERVMFWPQRDANPFFHFMESLWMLAGRNDVEFVARYVRGMRAFSDDGETFHGAYGHRWRFHFNKDQLNEIVKALKKNPDCRRQVLTMWDPRVDLGRKGKDLPCNLQAVFQIAHDGRLDMMVTNRSNDLIWGAYGANAVHFSYLHEYIARRIGVEQGVYRQVSANLHAYVDVLEKVQMLADEALNPFAAGHSDLHWKIRDPYVRGMVEPFPLINGDPDGWDDQLKMFLSDPTAMGFRDPFFRRVAIPMWQAYQDYKNGGRNRFILARARLYKVYSSDWRTAATEWVDRREAKWRRADSDGPQHGS